MPNNSLLSSSELRAPRVLCFGRFFDEKKGGIEAHVLSLLSSLCDRVDFCNLVPSKNCHGGTASIADKVPVVITPSWNVDGSLALSPQLIWQAWRLYRQQRFDIVHLHFPDPMSHLASLVLPKRVKRVITWHADIVRQKRLLTLYKPFLLRQLKRADAVIVATPNHKKSLFLSPDIVAPEKIHVIPYGVSPHSFSANAEQVSSLRAHYGKKRLLFTLGRHVSYKGFDVLLAALRELPADVHLLLGGQGPLSEKLKATAHQLGVADRVSFLGHIPDADLPACFNACDIFCLPSVTAAEAFGIVQIEAMSAAKPVVSTRLNTGVDYVNQDGVTGLTVPPGDSKALAEALMRLLDRPDWAAQLGLQARERVQREFTIDEMAAETLKLYRSLLTEK